MTGRRIHFANPTQVMEAGRIWARLFPHDRIAWYFIAIGIHDPAQQQAKNDWYDLSQNAREEIASQMLRHYGYFREFDP